MSGHSSPVASGLIHHAHLMKTKGLETAPCWCTLGGAGRVGMEALSPSVFFPTLGTSFLLALPELYPLY